MSITTELAHAITVFQATQFRKPVALYLGRAKRAQLKSHFKNQLRTFRCNGPVAYRFMDVPVYWVSNDPQHIGVA